MQQTVQSLDPGKLLSKGDEDIDMNSREEPSTEGMSVPKEDKHIKRSESSESTASDTNSQSRRPRRATSQRVDYDLKKRRIIPSDDYSNKAKRPIGEKTTQINGDVEDDENSGELANEAQNVIDLDESGNASQMHEPKHIVDAKNGATGLPLSQGPSDKIKKEYLWNFKKSSSNPNSNSNSYSNISNSQANFIIKPEWIRSDTLLEDKLYKLKLKTRQSDALTKMSDLRENVSPNGIHENERDKYITEIDKKEELNPYIHTSSHIKIKATISKESQKKLFGQNSIANLPPKDSLKSTAPVEEIENDDFCSSCSQSGSFLCCDTCPGSFHFLCLNPPLNADNLPEGDWSCPQCTFKLRFSNQSQVKKVEKEFIQNRLPQNCKLFGKLIFQLEATNPRQFKLPQSIKDTFLNVKTGSRDQYVDERQKDPISEKQLFGTPYGQSITRMDSYNPESHFDQETGELLQCYKCGKSKLGTWDNPYESRLIMRCDYCNTPWHLDCITNVPRSSLKNLGTRWRCPLHAPDDRIKPKQRKLTKNQKFIVPSQTCGFKNNGEIDVILDEISAPGSKDMVDCFKHSGDFPPISVITESSIKLDFMDKIYRAKKVQRDNEMRCQEHLIDKLVTSSSLITQGMRKPDIGQLLSFIYFTISRNSNSKKLWDLKELCTVAKNELEKEKISSTEINQLIMLKKLLETKPKEELMKFFNLEHTDGISQNAK